MRKILALFLLISLTVFLESSKKDKGAPPFSRQISSSNEFSNALSAVNEQRYTPKAKRLFARDSLVREKLGIRKASTKITKPISGIMFREGAAPFKAFPSAKSSNKFVDQAFVFTAQNYRENMKETLVAEIAGTPQGTKMAVAFKKINLEPYFDYLLLVEKSGRICDIYTGNYPEGVLSAFCEGNSVEVRVVTDSSVSGFEGSGFEILGSYQEVESQTIRAASHTEDPEPPVAVAQADPPRQWEGESIQFIGSNSFPSRGLRYFWSFGDGATSTAANPEHIYLSPGGYSVRLTVRDSRNRVSTDQISVFVERLEPPDNFGIESISARRAVLGWNDVQGAYGFKINVVRGFSTPSCNGIDIGKVNRYLLTNLSPQTNYSVAICSYNSNKTSNRAVSVFQTTPINPPPAPTGLQVFNLRSTSFSLIWSAPTQDTVGFRIGIAEGLIAPSCTNALSIGSANSYSFQNLLPGRSYSVSVCAGNIDGDFSQSRLGPVIMGPPEPSQLAARGTSPSSLKLTWRSGGLNTSAFLVRITPGATAPPPGCAGGINVGNFTTYDLEQLSDDSLYSLRVCAVGNGVVTDGITSSGWTWVLDPRNKPPKGLITSFPVESNIQGNFRYIVVINKNGNVFSNSINLSDPASRWSGWILIPGQLIFTDRPLNAFFQGNLIRITAHDYKLRDYFTSEATCTNGRCNWKNWIKTPENLTPQPSDPSNLSVSNISTTSARLNWIKATVGLGNLDYRLAILPGGLAPETCASGRALGDVSTTNLTGLIPGYSYSVRLCSSNARGTLSTGQVLTFKSSQAVKPPEISQLRLSATSPTSVRLNWLGGGGSTAGYRVALTVGRVPPANCQEAISSSKELSYSANMLKPRTFYSVRVCAQSSGGAISDGLTVTFDTTPVVAKINAGGRVAGDFSADSGFAGGNTSSVSKPISTIGISSPAPVAVYQSVRFGKHSYSFSSLEPSRPYTVRLHFSENFGVREGQRIFDMSINERKVLQKFDVFKEASGNFKAIIREFTVSPTASGRIQISSDNANAMVSGIEVLALTGAQFTVGTSNLGTPEPFSEFTSSSPDPTFEFGVSQLNDVRPWIGFGGMTTTTQSFKFTNLTRGATYGLRIIPAATTVSTFVAEVVDPKSGVITGGQTFRPLVAGWLTEQVPWLIKFVAQDASVTLRLRGPNPIGNDYLYFDYIDTFFP